MAAPKGPQQKKKLSLLHKVIIACVIGFGIGSSVIAAIVIPHFAGKGSGSAEIKTPEQIKAEMIAQAKRAEETATWETYHCNLMHRYFEGNDGEIPIAELLGLDSTASEGDIESRCAELLSTVRLMGGLPSSRPQQDNFVVCDGFELLLPGAGDLTIRPAPEDLKHNVVRYGPKGDPEAYEQEMTLDQSVRIGEYAPIVTKADDRCVVVAVRRSRGAGIAAEILRVNAGPAPKPFLKN